MHGKHRGTGVLPICLSIGFAWPADPLTNGRSVLGTLHYPFQTAGGSGGGRVFGVQAVRREGHCMKHRLYIVGILLSHQPVPPIAFRWGFPR